MCVHVRRKTQSLGRSFDLLRLELTIICDELHADTVIVGGSGIVSNE